MPKSQTTKSLYAVYLSTLGILLLLLTLAQGIIQFALATALSRENAYNVMNTQQLRTQRLIRNSILLLVPTTSHPAILLSLYVDEQQWEQTQDGIDHGNAGLRIAPGDFSADVHNRLANAHADYEKMEAALHSLLLRQTRETKPSQADGVDISTIFYSGQVYSSALLSAASDLFTESSVYVSNIRLIEVGLFALCLLVLVGEYTLVFRPAFAQMRQYLAQLQQVIIDQGHLLHGGEEQLHVTFGTSGELPEQRGEVGGIIDDVQQGLFGSSEHPHEKGK